MNPKISKLKKLAEAGDVTAMAELGYRYFLGYGIKINIKQSIYWLTKAVDGGCVKSMWRLGTIYWNEFCNYKEAIKLMRKAADSGFTPAMEGLGFAYTWGRGVQVDYKQSMKWYKKGADNGCVDSMRGIGMLYINGWGVEKDKAEGDKWCKMATDTYSEAKDEAYN